MSSKIILVCVVVLVLLQISTWGSEATVLRKRDATTEKPSDASQTIDEALQSFKTGVDNLLQNIQSNELFQNVTHSLKQFGEQVQNQSKQLVEKIQTSTKS